MESQQDFGDIVLWQQVAFIGRFVVVLGVLGFLKWWAHKVLGLDIEKDINSIEKAAHDYAQSGGEKGSIWPLALLLVVGLYVIGSIISGFISGGL